MEQNRTSEIEHFNTIEWLRFLAVLGILWFHDTDAKWRSIGYAGLPTFLLIFCALIVIHHKGNHFNEFIRKRGRRLLIPWLFWSLIFIIVRIALCYFAHTSINLPPINIVLVGGNIHLWFLPFVFLASVILYWVCNQFLGPNMNLYLFYTALFTTIIVIYTCSFLTVKFSYSPPFAQWLFALPSMPLGFVIGYSVRYKKKHNQLVHLAIACSLVLSTCILAYWLWKSPILVPYGVGTVLTTIAFCIAIPNGKLAVKFGVLAYGIYLIHPLVMGSLNHIFHNLTSLSRVIGTFIISAVIVYLLRLTSIRFAL